MEESEDLSQRLGQGDRKLEGEPVLRYKGARCKTRTSRDYNELDISISHQYKEPL